MTVKRKENRGGKRKGAGRKPIFELSEDVRLEIIADVKAEAELNNTSIGRVIAQMIFKPGGDQRHKTAGLQMYLRDVLAKSGDRSASANPVLVPQIFIPEKYPDDDTAPDYTPERH